MSHLDEGTLHALLDGELETTEVAEIQAHLGSCSACGLRLREVKEFLGEADRLIASVELGAVAAAPSAAKADAAPRHEPIARPEAPARREPAARPLPAEAPAREPWNEPPPVLLIPDNESAADRRARRLRRFGWGALAASMIGAGFLGVKMRPTQPGLVPIAGRAAEDSGPVVSPAEAAPSADQPATPESVTFAAKDRRSETKTKATPPAPANAAGGRAARELASSTLQKQATPAAKALQPRDEQADVQTIDSLAEDTADQSEADSAAGTDIANVRERAAEALADLDRERRRDRAAAATAALDTERRRRIAAARTAPTTSGVVGAAAAPAPTPPAPPTMEQRAQVYTRIGLDEASQQLGGPTHVIEGLSPMFMGLTRGTGVLGADPSRPVVRVVYQDSQGRLILLDQQRLAARQSPPAASPLSWMIGQTAIWLNGEASGQILRTYRPRVR
jgi:anti-sigma factor RsiW